MSPSWRANRSISDASSSICASAARAVIWSRVNAAGMPNANIEPRQRSAMMSDVRRAFVAGTWYPGTAIAVASEVDRYLTAADRGGPGPGGDLVALIAPHAGLMYS